MLDAGLSILDSRFGRYAWTHVDELNIGRLVSAFAIRHSSFPAVHRFYIDLALISSAALNTGVDVGC